MTDYEKLVHAEIERRLGEWVAKYVPLNKTLEACQEMMPFVQGVTAQAVEAERERCAVVAQEIAVAIRSMGEDK